MWLEQLTSFCFVLIKLKQLHGLAATVLSLVLRAVLNSICLRNSTGNLFRVQVPRSITLASQSFKWSTGSSNEAPSLRTSSQSEAWQAITPMTQLSFLKCRSGRSGVG